MDELDLLSQHRPAPLPPTSAERAAAEEQLMTHIAEHAPPTAVEGPPAVEDPRRRDARRGRRTRRAVAMVGAAAAVGLVALAVGVADRGPAPLRAEPTAAQQLEAIATVLEGASPYPDGPYAVTSRVDSAMEGARDGDGTVEQTIYRVSDADSVTDAGDCEGQCVRVLAAPSRDLGFPLDGTAAEVRAGVAQQVEDFRGPDDGPEATSWLTLSTAMAGLQHPAVGPEVRAELLRIVADTADLTSESGVETAYGLAGTRFTATTPGGRFELVVDPADGYILEVHMVSEGENRIIGEDGSETSETEVFDTTVTYERPVATDPLPADVAALAADVEAHHAEIEAGWPGAGCAGHIGGVPKANDWGIEIPDHLGFLHCWQG